MDTSLILTIGNNLIFKRRYHITPETQSPSFSEYFILIMAVGDPMPGVNIKTQASGTLPISGQ